MNKALSDLLESALDDWYAYLSVWQAPGASGRAACELCADSPFVRAAGLEEWPHDVAHRLVRSLTAAVRQVRISLEELDEQDALLTMAAPKTALDSARRSSVLGRHAQFLVLEALVAHTPVMRDVLAECIGPRLDDYIDAQVAIGFAELERAIDLGRD